MAKQKVNKSDASVIFWAAFSILVIWLGINILRDGVRLNQLKSGEDLTLPVACIIFGGMILGVAINKYSNSLRSKNGKGKK